MDCSRNPGAYCTKHLPFYRNVGVRWKLTLQKDGPETMANIAGTGTAEPLE